MSEVVLGVDVGSSSVKTVAVDREGAIVAQGAAAYDLTYPRPGWVEQDAEDWYRCTVRSMDACLVSIDARDVVAISVDGPAHNVALLDDSGEVVAPVIHWSDLRSAPQAKRLDAAMGERLLQLTLQRANPSWTLAQLAWVKEERPGMLEAAALVLVTKDFVRYRLTGVAATDPYDAVGTQLYDIAGGDWSAELCAAAGVDVDRMNNVLAPTAVGGRITADAARATGLAEGPPVFVGSGDTVTEGLGVGVTDVGDALVKLATSGTVMTITDRPEPDPVLLTYPHVVPGRWIAMASTNSGAGTLRWFRRAFLDRIDCDWGLDAIGDLAAASAPGAAGMVFHPFLSGERSPYWDAGLRAGFTGMGVATRLEDFARACLEGVAMSLRDGFESLQGAGYEMKDLRLIGGGAQSDVWAQIMADVLGRSVERRGIPAPAYGTALVAAIGLGWFDWGALPETDDRGCRVFEPVAERRGLYDLQFARYQSLVPAMAFPAGAAP